MVESFVLLCQFSHTLYYLFATYGSRALCVRVWLWVCVMRKKFANYDGNASRLDIVAIWNGKAKRNRIPNPMSFEKAWSGSHFCTAKNWFFPIEWKLRDSVWTNQYQKEFLIYLSCIMYLWAQHDYFLCTSNCCFTINQFWLISQLFPVNWPQRHK